MRFPATTKIPVGTLLVALLAACTQTPPSAYAPLDPVFPPAIQASTIAPVIIFEADKVKAVYDPTPPIPAGGGGGSGSLAGAITDLVFTLAISATNEAVIAERKREAYQTALPVLQHLSMLDLKSDFAAGLVAESKARIPWLRLSQPIAITLETVTEREKKVSGRPGYLATDVITEMLAETPRPFTDKYMLLLNLTQRIQQNYALGVNVRIFSVIDHAMLYHNHVLFRCGDPAAKADWVSWWSADGGNRVRTAYKLAAQAVPQALAFDLGQATSSSPPVAISRQANGALEAVCQPDWWK